MPNDPSIASALWAYCASSQYNTEVRKLDRSLKVTPRSLLNVPFDLAHWQKVATEKYPNDLPQVPAEVFRALGEYREHMLLVGGWVPPILMPLVRRVRGGLGK